SAGGQHCIYIGSRALPSSNVTLHRNICYNAAWNGFHINGRFTNLQVDQNIIYSDGIAGLSLQEGVSNSFFRNNLIFNSTSQGIEISNYPGDCAQFGQGGQGSICPYDQTGNLFENNTVYQTGFDGKGLPVQQPAVKVKNNAINRVGDLGHQTWRNNIFIGYGMASHYPSVVYVDGDKDYLSTSMFSNNIFWSLDGANTTAVIGFGYNANYGYQGYTCNQAASITTISGCMNVDPNFVNVSPAYYSLPGQFNFSLQAGSPAIGAGAILNAPVFDILGATRRSPPGVGAFEANSALSRRTVALYSGSCTPASLNSGVISTCPVALSQAASSGNAAITLLSSTQALTVPATVTVAAGSSSATFTATAGTISTAQTAVLTATLSGASQTASITLVSSQSAGGSAAEYPITPATTLPQMHAAATQVNGVTNTTSMARRIAPSGLAGTVVVNGNGSVNYAAGDVGNGVYFKNCCSNTNDAYYHFTGTGVGTAFNVSQGQIKFSLRSRYSFAQRASGAAAPRYAFDVRDGNGRHLFYFTTQVNSGVLSFSYLAAGTGASYYVPPGTEDILFGNGVILKVTILWQNGVARLYLNNNIAQSATSTLPTPNWSGASVFDLGAFEY